MNARTLLLVLAMGSFTWGCGDGSTDPAGGGAGAEDGAIVFVSDSAGLEGVGTMRADGSGRRSFVPRQAGSISAVLVDPAAERAVFVRDGTPRYFDSADGTEVGLDLRVGAVPQGWTDSDRIVWTAPGAGGSEGTAYAMFTTTPDGRDVEPLEPPITNWSAHVRVYRVDGEERIAYRGLEPKGASQIYSVRLDGTDLRQLTDDFYSKERPSPSPDGRSVVYWVIRQTPHRTIDMVAGDGEDPISLLAPDDFAEWERGQVRQVAWCPDGTRLAVEVNLGSTDSIWLAFPDGRPPILLNLESALSPLIWSPDGTALLVQHDRDVARVDLGTGALRPVAETPSVQEWPVAWLP